MLWFATFMSYRVVSHELSSGAAGIIYFCGDGSEASLLGQASYESMPARIFVQSSLLCLQPKHRDDDQNVASLPSRCSISWTMLSMHLAHPPGGIMTTVIPLSPRLQTL